MEHPPFWRCISYWKKVDFQAARWVYRRVLGGGHSHHLNLDLRNFDAKGKSCKKYSPKWWFHGDYGDLLSLVFWSYLLRFGWCFRYVVWCLASWWFTMIESVRNHPTFHKSKKKHSPRNFTHGPTPEKWWVPVRHMYLWLQFFVCSLEFSSWILFASNPSTSLNSAEKPEPPPLQLRGVFWEFDDSSSSHGKSFQFQPPSSPSWEFKGTHPQMPHLFLEIKPLQKFIKGLWHPPSSRRIILPGNWMNKNPS